MHKYLALAAYGWLAISGALHFVVDVVSQHLRGKRLPGAETTLYYGLNSAFALGQVALGLVGLWIAWRHLDVLSDVPVIAVSIATGLAWLAITFLFMEYSEPKFNAAVYCLLVIAAAAVRGQ